MDRPSNPFFPPPARHDLLSLQLHMNRPLLFALLGVASTGALFAQTAGEVIIDRVQQGTPPAAPGAPASASTQTETGDLDGGTQRLAQTRSLPFKLTFGYDLQAFQTSNVFLRPGNEEDALVIANTLQARAEFNSLPVGEGLLTPSAGLVIQRFNHAVGTGSQDHKDLDFDAYSIPLALRLRYGNNWEFGLGVTGTAVYSLEGPPSYNLTYRSATTAISARKLVSLGENQVLSLGGALAYVITDAEAADGSREDRNDKIDTSLDAAYYYLKDRWVFSAYGRILHSDFRHYEEVSIPVDREDLTFSLGLSAAYNLTPWATARAFTSYDWRKPQGDSFVDYSYETASVGLGLSLNISF